jgi:BirA family transcriptional regulator, biotin operon repressor / biotin---[acetyl-CoA-carboxylase] ligase
VKPDVPISLWADALEQLILGSSIACIDRVRVMAETTSTQDACRAAAAGKPGLLVVADRQTGGRGRLGRVWTHAGELGIAATFALDETLSAPMLAMAGGLGACTAVQQSTSTLVGLRWPNDVVERTDEGNGRKIGGVLVERGGGVALLGVGINVRQTEAVFLPDIKGRAASIAMLGGESTRLEVLFALVRALDRALRMGVEGLAAAWRKQDCLIGLEREFEHDGRRVRGIVMDIDPLGRIVLETKQGLVSLPALTTSLVHGV